MIRPMSLPAARVFAAGMNRYEDNEGYPNRVGVSMFLANRSTSMPFQTNAHGGFFINLFLVYFEV